MSFAPDIVIPESDAFVLRSLVRETPANRDVLDFLDQEVSRASVLPNADIGPGIARLGTVVSALKTPAGEVVYGMLVPHAAEAPSPSKRPPVFPSMLAPVLPPVLPMTSMDGAALIGLRVGQSIDYYDCDGQLCCLELLSAELPAEQPDTLPPAPRGFSGFAARMKRLLRILRP